MNTQVRPAARQAPSARSQKIVWIVAFLAFFLAALPGALTPPATQEGEPIPYGNGLASIVRVVERSIFRDDEFSNRLFVDAVRNYAEHGDANLGGFMLAFEEGVHVAAVRHIDGPGVHRAAYPYISSFNLQYALGKRVVTGNPAAVDNALIAMQVLLILAMAAVVASIAVFGRRWFGTLGAVLTVAIFALSPMVLTFSRSLYWDMFLFFLPFLATAWLYPRASGRAAFAGLVGLVAGLVMLKSLTGYEFLSNIALGAALPILFHELQAAEGPSGWPVKRIVLRSLAIGLGSVAGFLAAAGLHVAKAAAFFGSWYKGFQAIYVPFSYSTIDQGHTGIRSANEISLANVALVLSKTYAMFNFQIMLPLYGALAVSSAVLVARHAWRPSAAWQAIGRLHRALAITFVASILATLSWEVLAVNHALAHPHINWMTSYMFANIFAAWLLGMNIRFIHDGRGVTTSGTKA